MNSSIACKHCRTEIAPLMLSCPGCHALVYAQKLSELSAESKRAREAEDLALCLENMREMLSLLPATTRQYLVLVQEVQALSTKIDTMPRSERKKSTTKKSNTNSSALWSKRALGLGGAALLIWKLKFVIVFVLTKGKFLLLGLTKMSTVFSMILSMGLYWSIWGWQFAAGLIASIYIHEMGHVWSLRRFGVPASAPMFIPGLGAVVRLKQGLHSPIVDARVGLAGPMWGAAAAIICGIVGYLAPSSYFMVIAKVGAWINLFNLTPVWQLDGARAFAALSRKQAWIMVLSLGAAWFTSHESLLFLVMLVAAWQALLIPKNRLGDWQTTLHYALLVAALSALAAIEIVI